MTQKHMKANIKIVYDKEKDGFIHASVFNSKSGRWFFLGRYSTMEKAKYLGPKMLNKKIAFPSSVFKDFLEIGKI